MGRRQKKINFQSTEFETFREAINSATGALFSGKPVRTFTGYQRVFSPGWHKGRKVLRPSPKQCAKWAVVTTISAPTEAVEVIANLIGWCIIIIGDNKTPTDYLDQIHISKGRKSFVHFLTIDGQLDWASHSGPEMYRFVQSVPMNHFARKNIGYLYAIQNGANYIFDFDDDNVLLTNPENGQTMDPLDNDTHLESARVPLVGTTVFNHHTLMNASIVNSWPRGFPLEMLQTNETFGKVIYVKQSMSLQEVAVLQYCAQNDPDIDAVHRLTKPLPMEFNQDVLPLTVPSHSFAPYNAQATIHTQAAFWAMLLPHTVPGRVSDIWRGYFAQAIFRSLGISLCFLPPKVRQDRNVHNYLGDMRAELDLYFKTGKLIEFLSTEWECIGNSVPECMEELWIHLYERTYIELDDVLDMQLWLKALVECGYLFPPILRKRYNNVLVVGDFGIPDILNSINLDSIVFWAQKWREWFVHVESRGPFNASELLSLKSRGVMAYAIKGTNTAHPSLQNLFTALDVHKTSEVIKGILYIRGDILVNVPQIIKHKFPFPTNQIIVSAKKSTKDDVDSDCYYNVFPNKTWNKKVANTFQLSDKDIECTSILTELSQDTRMETYLQKDKSFLVHCPIQSKMLFVPTINAETFQKISLVMQDYNVLPECSFSAILGIINVVSVKDPIRLYKHLCSCHDNQQTSLELLEHCQSNGTCTDYYPLLLSMGFDVWARLFDKVMWQSEIIK